MAEILNEYMVDYVDWLTNPKLQHLPFSSALLECQRRRVALSNTKYIKDDSYGYSIENPILGYSSPHIREYIPSFYPSLGFRPI